MSWRVGAMLSEGSGDLRHQRGDSLIMRVIVAEMEKHQVRNGVLARDRMGDIVKDP